MSGLLALAEQYYAVAADQARMGHELLRIAELLNRHADALCEMNVKKQPAASPETPGAPGASE